MLIYQTPAPVVTSPKSSDTTSDAIAYNDFSLMKRMKTNLNNMKNRTGTQKQNEREKWENNTKLQCLEIDNEDPLSPCDWK